MSTLTSGPRSIARSLKRGAINARLRELLNQGVGTVVLRNPGAKHSIAVGILHRLNLHIEGSCGYFACGLIDGPNVTIKGRVGWACGENMMAGTIVIEKNGGSQFGAALRGGDLVCKGSVGGRTGIDQKGGTIIVGGDTGSFSGFMMQRGRIVILGNAGKNLGDSMYDGTIYLGGEARSFGVDAVPGEMTDGDREWLSRKLKMYDLYPKRRYRSRQKDRRRQTALELRQPRAERKKARALIETGHGKEKVKNSCSTQGRGKAASAAKSTKAAPKSAASTKRKPASAAAAVIERAPAEAKKYLLGSSKIFTPEVMNDIHIKSELGRYRMRGFSLFKKIPHWDDLTFLPGTLTRFVIEGYREKCETRTVIGPRAKRPMVLDIPVYVTGMSFGALSYEAKIALARGATMAGSATCSGEGGMIPDERRYSERWFYQCIQSRYGFNPHHLRIADGCEFFIGQGCKVGLGGHLMGQKVTDQVAEMRSLPAGIDQRSPARHPDWLGPDDLALKIEEIREATNHEIPIQLKLGAARVYDDVRMAVKCGPDSIYIDAMEGGTGAGPHIAAEDTGIPGIAAIREARRAIDELGKRNEISLVYAGGIRNGGDVAKAMALGADAIAIGHSVLMALNCNKHIEGVTDYPNEIGVEAGYCYHCHTGRCPVGVATQDPLLRQRLDPDKAAERVYNFLHTLTMEAQLLARACGKTNIHSLEPEDLAALTMEASAMCKVPLAGTNYTVGMENGDYHKY